MSLGKDLWSHKLVAVRAVLTGWAMFFSFAAWIRPVIGRLLFPNPGIQSPLLIGGVPFDAVFSYNFAASVTLLFAAGAVSGWTIGRFHRSCRKTAVFAYAASFLLIDAILFGPFLFLGATLFLYVASVTAGVLTGGGIFRKIPVPPVTS